MSERVDRELRELFEGAGEPGACIPAPSHRLLMALRRRMGEDGTVVSPARGLYAEREAWGRLDPTEQSLSIMRGLQERTRTGCFAARLRRSRLAPTSRTPSSGPSTCSPAARHGPRGPTFCAITPLRWGAIPASARSFARASA